MRRYWHSIRLRLLLLLVARGHLQLRGDLQQKGLQLVKGQLVVLVELLMIYLKRRRKWRYHLILARKLSTLYNLQTHLSTRALSILTST